MELKQFADEFISFFSKLESLPTELMSKILNHDIGFFKTYVDRFGLERDWIREFYQYYFADRENLKQDYTPDSLSALVASLAEGKTILDLCAGSGSLTLKTNPDSENTTIELDEKVIPFQIFNLVIRNRKAIVLYGNALSEEFMEGYRIGRSNDGFSLVNKIECKVNLKADSVISNPPFNLKGSGTQNCKTGNFEFILKALDLCTSRAVLILPCGVLSESVDTDTVRDLVDDCRLEAVIKLPEKMFASTSIPVCILVLNKVKQDRTVFVDAASMAKKEIREQNGQYGANSHTGRTYKKEFSVLDEEAIKNISKAVNQKNKTDFSAVVKPDQIKKNDYRLIPSLYIEENQDKGNGINQLEWIAEQYNQIVRFKNCCKVTINETLAKELNVDKELWEKAKAGSEEVAKAIERVSGLKLEKEDYLTFTKGRELSIKFKSKEELPPIFHQFVSLWTNQTILLNNMENKMLGQMRDLILPKLMSGEIEISEQR